MFFFLKKKRKTLEKIHKKPWATSAFSSLFDYVSLEKSVSYAAHPFKRLIADKKKVCRGFFCTISNILPFCNTGGALITRVLIPAVLIPNQLEM